MSILSDIKGDLSDLSDRKQAKILQRFFKTGPGEYAEGDIFIGVKVPLIRLVAKKYQDCSYSTAISLLRSKIHEERFLALLLLMSMYARGNLSAREKIYKDYIGNTKYINNWDLVDVSAKHIVGGFLSGRERGPLYELAKSGYLWDRRIAVLATFHFINNNDFTDAIKISEILLDDPHDLIHKATGWMLREIGKRDMCILEKYLKLYCAIMPRTMLRYAIEKMPLSKRKEYMNKEKV